MESWLILTELILILKKENVLSLVKKIRSELYILMHELSDI